MLDVWRLTSTNGKAHPQQIPRPIIGMGDVVLQSITEAGTYVGVPAKKVK